MRIRSKQVLGDTNSDSFNKVWLMKSLLFDRKLRKDSDRLWELRGRFSSLGGNLRDFPTFLIKSTMAKNKHRREFGKVLGFCVFLGEYMHVCMYV